MRKSRLGVLHVNAEERPTPKKVEKNYEDIAEQRELDITDGIKLVFSVSKTSEGSPHLDIRTWVESEKYTGPTKKGINFDVENLDDFLEIVKDINDELRKKGL